MHTLTQNNSHLAERISTRFKQTFKKSLVVAAGATLFVSSASFAASAPTPYTAEYSGTYKGMKLTLKRELKRLSNGRYQVTNSASNSLAKFFESSDFYLNSSNQVKSNRYQYKTQYGPIKKAEDVRFDWKAKTAVDIKDSKQKPVALKSSTADRISYQVLQRQLVKAGKKNFSIDLFSRGKMDTYKFKVLAEETITTPAGKFKAIPVKKIYSGGSKTQTAWLAKDHDYILLKLVQTDGKSRYEVNVSKFSLKK